MKKYYLISLILLATVLFGLPGMLYAQNAQVVVVTSVEDSGAGTLREALKSAGPGTVITFSPQVFPKNDPVEIRLLRELPGLEAGNVTIDASGAGVILTAESGYAATCGFKIRSSNNTILGMEIIGFPDFGILIEPEGSNNMIGGIGRGEGNTIGWMDRVGIGITGDNNAIINNHIGIDREGKYHLSNNEFGIYIGDGASGNVIGGVFGVEGNIISGNYLGGVLINNGSIGTRIQGNIIGLDIALKHNIGNSGFGIRIENSMDTLVGGEELKFRNIISGNTNSAVDIMGEDASGNIIATNIVGHPRYGTNKDGVSIFDGAHDNQVGPGNTIAYSGNHGITIRGPESVHNTITANHIFSNNGIAVNIENGANGDISAPEITDASSRSVQGFAGPGQIVEVYSDQEEQAQYFECTTTADAQGQFLCTLKQGAFQERMLKVLTIDAAGNSSMLSDAFENRSLRVMQELPDIIAPSQVSKDPVVIGTNLSLAIISMVYFGFTTTIFGDLVEDTSLNWFPEKVIPQKMKGWFKRLRDNAVPGASTKKWIFILFWVLIVLINALIESFLEPNSSIMGIKRIRIILSLFMTGLIVNGVEWVTDWLVRRRILRDVKIIAQVRWVGLLAAMASVIFSRLVAFTPGYILGTLGTIFLLPDLTDGVNNGKRSALILTALFTCGALFWALSHFFSRFAPWIEPLFLNIFAISVQGVLFELLPFGICEGRNIWDWNKVLWFALFGISVFTFLHTFLNPDAPELQALQQNGVQVLLVAMVAYGLVTLILWLKSKQMKTKQPREQA